MEQIDYLLCDEATITPKGFLFKGNYYSCQMALKQRLFDPENWTDEEKKVEVLYEPLMSDKILVKLEGWKYCYANLIQPDSRMTPEEIQEYHNNIQLLKHDYRLHKKRKIQRRVILSNNNNCS
ncbi:hypothetical protein HZF08_01945 [Paenibacillus sp. CGMCC 1.16610]|uniref:Uncharacterized protein n=1 Tax=Paenibacillus anseongense TaxID=2682845 RepID=A0ABW9U4Z1_9BACL|nr:MULTISPECIES: hypothetical protein [Paenibacillus]MBA2937062.1 hypothetical protein [Paenibacillus sp. CGMCC 1.16610]MVQ33385.1 hypothetical protein [Paenibacillus anseongense]